MNNFKYERITEDLNNYSSKKHQEMIKETYKQAEVIKLQAENNQLVAENNKLKKLLQVLTNR